MSGKTPKDLGAKSINTDSHKILVENLHGKVVVNHVGSRVKYAFNMETIGSCDKS